MGDPSRGMAHAVWLFAFAIFASAFLIFGVQPMVGKHILPWFGGVPAVWMTCLAFYQSALFVGYAYAYGLAAWVPPRLQPWLHGGLFAASLAVLPVLPGAAWKPEPGGDSSARILAMLAANVALPFGLLAATGPLLQVWFARVLPSRSPYPLYAVSNAGSLLGLLSFPFLVEPSLRLSTQGWLWSVGYAATGAAVVGCAFWASRGARASTLPPASLPEEEGAPDAVRVALWVGLPASAVVLFMGVTNHLCLDVASAPFLWIVPLSIYLLTLILCFGSERIYVRGLFMPLAVASLAWLMAAAEWTPGHRFGFASAGSVAGTALRYGLALFCGCMVVHGELHRLRPGARRLTAFYLCLAGGGALGGLFVGLAAPRLFLGYRELPIGVAACWGLALVAVWRAPGGVFVGRSRVAAWSAVLGLTAAAVGLYTLRAIRPEPGTLAVERNFFGVLRVLEIGGESPFVVLRHGTTRHGLQYRSPGLRRLPTAYYGQISGIGLLLAPRMQQPDPPPLRLGVVGLGIGTLAAYGRPGDRFVFYEIDPAVVRVARDEEFFHYLTDSAAEIEMVTGDARLALEAELAAGSGRAFDVLVVDAFSSDAIPLHLLTEEAFRLYRSHLRSGGVLAVHVSNRNFDLAPQVARLGRAVGLQARLVENVDAPRWLTERSRWMMLSEDPGRFEALASGAERRSRGSQIPLVRVTRIEPERIERTPLWTDDFSNLLGLLARPAAPAPRPSR